MKGFKPIYHKSCGRQLAWVTEDTAPGMLFKSSDIRYLDGSQFYASDPLCCQCCNNRVTPGMLTLKKRDAA